MIQIIGLKNWVPSPAAILIGRFGFGTERCLLFTAINCGLVRLHIPTRWGWRTISEQTKA